MKHKRRLLKDVRPLYKGFLKYLDNRRETLAPIQTLCRLEDYLTKEFAAFIIKRSKGSVLPRLNFGDGRRIDLALATGDHSEVKDKRAFAANLTIRSLIELKYFCFGNRFSTAIDDVIPTLKDLHRQLGRFNGRQLGKYAVKLRSPKKEIYGMVFASFVHPENADDKYSDGERVQLIEKNAKKESFLSFNNKRPNLKKIYEDVIVRTLKTKYKVSLYAGLWRISADTKRPKQRILEPTKVS